MSRVLCAYPWAGAAVRPDGTVLPCCKFNHNKEFGNVRDQDPRNSSEWNQLREQMLSDVSIKNCESCYKEEQSGVESLRQQSLKFYKPTASSPIALRQLEVSFNNICNLACVMCSEEFSTRWQTEKVKHRGLTVKGVTSHNFDYLEWDLSEVRQLKIIGGEPMMSQDKFVELLKRLDRANLSVIIATNASILPNDELKNLLESCDSVSFKVSLDGIGIVNDWIRWPSKFDHIENNINIIEEWWQEHNNINLEFHTVVGAYNLFFLEQIIHYVKNRSAWTHSWNWIRHPEWQAVNVLPNKHEVVRELELLTKQYVFMGTNPFKVSIDRLHDSTILGWNDFKFENQRLEKERNMCSPISKLG